MIFNTMNSKIYLRTIIAILSWFYLQNFNILPKNQENTAACRPGGKGTYKIKKVVLDAGHGGKDPGCIGASSREKHNALAIVLRLGEYLKLNFPDLQIIYTRDSDVFVELNERAAIANRTNADLFISVHCNSLSVARTKGTETYVLGLHRAQHNLEVAKRENASIYLEDNYEKNYGGYDPKSPEAHIFSSMWQSAYLEQSILFAGYVQQFAKSIAGREDKGVKQAGFLVLRETAMPSVLVEAGYLTNKTEEEFLASFEGQDLMAEAIFEAFRAYKYQMEGQKPDAIQPGSKIKRPPVPAPVLAETKIAQTPTATTKTVSNVAAKQEGKPVEIKKASNSIKAAFRIQLAAAPNKLDMGSGAFELLAGVQEEVIDGKYHYFVGEFLKRSEAEKMLPELRNLGFSNATIISNNN